jgi:hypothetical protein
MEMRIVMSKKEAQQLLADALRPKLGATVFKVETVKWDNYSSDVTFELESVEPEIEPIRPAPSRPPLSIDDDLPSV